MSKNKFVALLCPLFFLGLGIFMEISVLSMARNDKLFPRVVGWLMILFAVIGLISELKNQDDKNLFANIDFVKLGCCLLSLCVYVFMMGKIGFFLDTLLLTSFNMWLLGYRKYKILVMAALIITSVVFGAFYFLIKVPLPTLFL